MEACLDREELDRMEKETQAYENHVRDLQIRIRSLAPSLRGKETVPGGGGTGTDTAGGTAAENCA